MKRAPLTFVLLVVTAGPAAAQTKLTLPEVVARSMENPLARAADYATEAAEAQLSEALGARFPRLQVTGFVAPSPEIDCNDAACTTTSPEDVDINIAGVFGGVRAEVTQPLYTFGKLSSISAAARNAARATRFLEDVVAGDLTVNATRAYYGLKLARELVWMLEDGLEQIVKGLDSIEEALEAGSAEATVQDRLRLETLKAEVEARLTEAREAAAIALAGIRALVGDANADIDETPLEAMPYDLAATAQPYAERALVARPELRAARAAVTSVGALLDYEKARYFPDFALFGGINFAAAHGVDDPPSAFANDPFNTASAQIGLVLRWNLDVASQPARVDRARAETKRVAALAQAAERGTALEVQRAHARASQAKARLAATAAGEQAARGWVASVIQGEAVGVIAAKDLADAYVSYFTLRSRVLQTTFDWNLAIVELQRVAGEFAVPGARP